jgi:tRNA-splicing ligase RtcB (3'-phosphate/5'-hydroxy nucleic acid ligase)
MKEITSQDLIQISESMFEIEKSFRSDMQVAARVITNNKMLKDILKDGSLNQLVNVATLPGICGYAFAMPDIHQGYGFPIGGVAATVIGQGGVISPGGIGYDINCGVRLLRANCMRDDIKERLDEIATQLHKVVPSGVGRSGNLKLSLQELDKVLTGGANYMLELGYGTEADIIYCEEHGRMAGADAHLVSESAKQRGHDQLGTLGSGNHFLEIQYVQAIFNQDAAEAYGLEKDQVTIMIHCGSRGLGHQVCTDYVRLMMSKIVEWGIDLPDRELISAPFASSEGQAYFSAMQAASNFAWANRHLIAHSVRKAWLSVFGGDADLSLVYDVSHNIGKHEKHLVAGKDLDVLVHRKGATRAFGPGHSDIPVQYQHVGQPVLIPGTMGTASYVLAGTSESMEVAFGTCCHGAGRKMSRMQSRKEVKGAILRGQLENQGIVIRSDSDPGLAEEAPQAYKDIEEVVAVVQNAKLAKKVARLVPLAVIKGG